MEFTTRELSIANKVAYDCSLDKNQRELTKSFLYLWMVEHFTTVQRYRSEEGGEDKLYVAMRNAHYRQGLKNKREQRPDLFDFTHSQNKELRRKIGEDIQAGLVNETVGYILSHKHREALSDYFTGEQKGVPLSKKYGLHESALYRAVRNTQLLAREHNPRRYL